MSILIPTYAYLDAVEEVCHPSGELGPLVRVGDGPRESLRVAGECVRVRLSDGKEEWILSIPTSAHFALPTNLIRMRIFESESVAQLAEAKFMTNLLNVRNSHGTLFPHDALLQRCHTPLDEFVRRHCSIAERGKLRRAIGSIEESLELFCQRRIQHGALGRHSICFDSSGDLRILDYPISLPSNPKSDVRQLAIAALLLYVGGCDIPASRLLSVSSSSDEERAERLRAIHTAAEHHGCAALASLAYALLMGASEERIVHCIRGVWMAPFRPLPQLESLLRKSDEWNDIDLGCRQEPEESMRVSFVHCDEVAPAGDNFVRYRQGAYWGYADLEGRPLRVERRLLAAYDFELGRAVIRTASGYGLIDEEGRVVMNDVWSHLEWYAEEGVVVAENECGHWHIYDRVGHQLSSVACDWMGDASEGFVVASRGGKYGYFSVGGARMSDFIYEEAYGFHGGVALVGINGHRYYIDTTFHRARERRD